MSKVIVVKQICTYEEIPVEVPNELLEKIKVRYKNLYNLNESSNTNLVLEICNELTKLAEIKEEQFNDYIIDTDLIDDFNLRKEFEEILQENEINYNLKSLRKEVH